MNNDIIYCIGDSHVSFFSGINHIQKVWPEITPQRYPFFKSYRIGPVLAYNLCSFNTKNKGREKLLFILSYLIPFRSKIMLCFGEIDCRAHLIKQAKAQIREVEKIIEFCVERYIRVIKEIHNYQFEVIIWNVIPSAKDGIFIDLTYPYYGSNKERNRVSKYFNSFLMKRLNEENIFFLTIFEKLINKEENTINKYLFDGFHLSQSAMPFVLEILLKKYPKMKFLM